MVYALQVDRLERAVLAERQVVATLLATGATDQTLPSLTEAREQFDALLVERSASRSALSVEQRELREALGVAS